jgi:exosortase/archaeosortase family protein
VNKARFSRDSLLVQALIFVAVFGALEAVIWYLGVNNQLTWLLEGTAQVTARLVGLMGIPVTLNGIQLTLPRHILEIDIDCTAIQLAAVYVALVFARAASAKSRLVALGVGLPAIFVANQLRLLGVALASENLPESTFLFVHDYLFKVVMVLVIGALWLWWMQWDERATHEV